MNLFPRNLDCFTHDIFKSYHFFPVGGFFGFLSRLKISQIPLRDCFRDLVSCQRHHAKGNDAAFLNDRNIRRTGSYIDQCNIQKAEPLRNRHIDRRNRLQCQTCHMQSGILDRLIQSVYDFIRQKCCNHLHTDGQCHMFFDHLHRISIQIIFYRRIPNAVKMFAFMVILLANAVICLFYRYAVK